MSSNLAVRLADARRTISNMRSSHRDEMQTAETQALQHVIAIGGGVLGACARQWLPALIPGSAADSPLLLATVLVLDGVAAYSGSPEMLALAFSYEGKVTGDAFETAMGWRSSPDKA